MSTSTLLERFVINLYHDKFLEKTAKFFILFYLQRRRIAQLKIHKKLNVCYYNH